MEESLFSSGEVRLPSNFAIPSLSQVDAFHQCDLLELDGCSRVNFIIFGLTRSPVFDNWRHHLGYASQKMQVYNFKKIKISFDFCLRSGSFSGSGLNAS